MTAWWPVSPSSQINTRDDRNRIEQSILQLSIPCDGSWLMARVLTLLLPDFTSDMPESVRRMEAEDWAEALGIFPQWAVEKACRWWRSDENPSRRRKPMTGDIQDRARHEMGVISMAKRKIVEFDRGRAAKVEPPRPDPTPEEMEKRRAFAEYTMAQFGFESRAPMIDKGKPSQEVTPEEIAEIMAGVNANAETRDAERQRRADVAADLQSRGLGIQQGSA
jgi:hypothetical protein